MKKLMILLIFLSCAKPSPDFALLEDYEIVSRLPVGNISFTGYFKPECISDPSTVKITFDSTELIFDVTYVGGQIRSITPFEIDTGTHTITDIELFDQEGDLIGFVPKTRDTQGRVVHPLSEWGSFEILEGEEYIISAFVFCEGSNLNF